MCDLPKLEAGEVMLEPVALRVSDPARQLIDVLKASRHAKTVAAQLDVDLGKMQEVSTG